MSSRSQPSSSSKNRSTNSSMGAYLSRATRQTPRTESIESLRRRNEAAEILQSYEKLAWYSYDRCETLTQTRIHFQCILAGLTPEQEEANVHWQEDFTPHAVKPPQQWNAHRKGKARVSSGTGAEVQESPAGGQPIGPSTNRAQATEGSSRPGTEATKVDAAQQEDEDLEEGVAINRE
ncbi:hypothetical protein Slin15195_G004470 [Septoria linicola]|uniref:Uncharacterized protein n=1 Tax=Septoria linicola TaxID=215465 RepID=A0A9Q9AJ56_9PEZI|nr:hypothetical protein Slin14017_G004510 [Septoria linicola]USW47128.1 hypothetical protein Slin15195_G004470 [Septoria linicola]